MLLRKHDIVLSVREVDRVRIECETRYVRNSQEVSVQINRDEITITCNYNVVVDRKSSCGELNALPPPLSTVDRL